MQSDAVIETATPIGGGISEVTLSPNATAILADTAGELVEPAGYFVRGPAPIIAWERRRAVREEGRSSLRIFRGFREPSLRTPKCERSAATRWERRDLCNE